MHRAGIIVNGENFTVSNNVIVGYDVGIQAQGKNNTVDNNFIAVDPNSHLVENLIKEIKLSNKCDSMQKENLWGEINIFLSNGKTPENFEEQKQTLLSKITNFVGENAAGLFIQILANILTRP